MLLKELNIPNFTKEVVENPKSYIDALNEMIERADTANFEYANGVESLTLELIKLSEAGLASVNNAKFTELTERIKIYRKAAMNVDAITQHYKKIRFMCLERYFFVQPALKRADGNLYYATKDGFIELIENEDGFKTALVWHGITDDLVVLKDKDEWVDVTKFPLFANFLRLIGENVVRVQYNTTADIAYVKHKENYIIFNAKKVKELAE